MRGRVELAYLRDGETNVSVARNDGLPRPQLAPKFHDRNGGLVPRVSLETTSLAVQYRAGVATLTCADGMLKQPAKRYLRKTVKV